MKSSGASIKRPRQTTEMTAESEAFYESVSISTEILQEATLEVPANTALLGM
jgi:hypothetical protein